MTKQTGSAIEAESHMHIISLVRYPRRKKELEWTNVQTKRMGKKSDLAYVTQLARHVSCTSIRVRKEGEKI